MNFPMLSCRFWVLPFIFLFVFSGRAFADANADFLLSLEKYRSGDYQKSCELLVPLQTQEQIKPHYALNYGHCLYMQKKYSQALEVYRGPVLQGSFSPASSFFQAKTLHAMGRLNEALKMNENVLAQSKTKNLQELAELQKQKWLAQKNEENAAAEMYRAEDWAGAHDALVKLGFENLSVEGRFLYLLTDQKLELTTDLETREREMEAMTWLSETEKQSLSVLGSELDSGEENPEKFWTYLDLSAGDNNNVYQEARSEDAISSHFFKAGLGFGKSFGKIKGLVPKISYNAAYDEPAEDRSLRTLSNQLQVQLDLLQKDSQLTFGGQLNHQIWDSASVSRSAGAFLRSSWTGKKFDGGFEAEGSEQVALDAATEYLTGQLYSLRAFLGTWSDNLYGQMFWIGGVEGTGDVTYSDGSVLPLAQNYSGPGVKITWRFLEKYLLAASGSSIHRDFKNETQPAAKKRIDDEVSVSLRLLYRISSAISVYGQYETVDNSSTLGATDILDKNYRSSIVTLGFNWDVLP